VLTSQPTSWWRYVTSLANVTGSTIEGSSFSGLLTRVEIGHIRIGSAWLGAAFHWGGKLCARLSRTFRPSTMGVAKRSAALEDPPAHGADYNLCPAHLRHLSPKRWTVGGRAISPLWQTCRKRLDWLADSAGTIDRIPSSRLGLILCVMFSILVSGVKHGGASWAGNTENTFASPVRRNDETPALRRDKLMPWRGGMRWWI
jgi:hypothetical protein